MGGRHGRGTTVTSNFFLFGMFKDFQRKQILKKIYNYYAIFPNLLLKGEFTFFDMGVFLVALGEYSKVLEGFLILSPLIGVIGG